MTNAQLKALIEERDKLRSMLSSLDHEISVALLAWSRERGFLMKLTAEQALREMEKVHA